jgi:hypothetical protein
MAGRRTPALILAVALTVTALAGATKAGAAGFRHCGDIGPPNSDVGVYRIVTQRVLCRVARRIVSNWYYDRSAPDAGPRGWRCRTQYERHYEIRTACAQGSKRIWYSQYLA